MIYQIYYINDPKINYIGSSLNADLNYRWSDHKSDYKKYLDNPLNNRANIYPYFKEYGIENFKIIKLKEFDVIDRKHLKAYEQLYINKYKPVNKLKPFNILFKEDKKNYRKGYYIQNIDTIKEKEHNRYKNNPDYFSNYAKENKERIKDYKHQYYLKQKENKSEQYQKLIDRADKLIKCEICNIELRQKHYKQHINTIKHKNNENGIIIDLSKDETKKLCTVCNCYTAKKNFSNHIKTKKHIENSK